MKRNLNKEDIAGLIGSILEHQSTDNLETGASYRFVLRFTLQDEYLEVKSADMFKIKEDADE